MPTVKSQKPEEHVEQLLERVRHANELGKEKKRDYWVAAYLDSYDAKLLAVQRANRQLKFDRRLNKAELRAIAARLS